MAKIIQILFFVFVTTSAFAQFRQNTTPRTDIIKFDFSTYQGTPIKTGWLIDDITYQKLYVSYNAADSLVRAFDQYEAMLQKLDTLHKQVVLNYEGRINDKDALINKQNKDFKDLNDLLNKSNDNVNKFEKQFWHVGKTYIHKGTAIKVGISVGILGWLIGKAGVL